MIRIPQSSIELCEILGCPGPVGHREEGLLEGSSSGSAGKSWSSFEAR